MTETPIHGFAGFSKIRFTFTHLQADVYNTGLRRFNPEQINSYPTRQSLRKCPDDRASGRRVPLLRSMSKTRERMSQQEPPSENRIERSESKHGDPWRYVCPRGHRSWRRLARNDQPYYCKQCQTHFDQLVDLKHEKADFDAYLFGGVR